jgi:hypothetical protein
MRVILSLDKQQQLNPEWRREFENLLYKNGTKKKYKAVKKIFVETYLEYVREGMNPKDALQKAKIIALCFLCHSNGT